MPGGVEYGLLGPLTVRRGGAEVGIAPGKQRALLAVLLLRGGKVAVLDELAEALWGEQPPASARVSLQNYVARLRRALGAGGDAVIVTGPGGYRIALGPGELDTDRFEAALAGLGRCALAAGRAAEAGDLLREALEIFQRMGAAEAPGVAAELDALAGPRPAR